MWQHRNAFTTTPKRSQKSAQTDDDCTGNDGIDEVARSLELHVAAEIISEKVIDDTPGKNVANHSEISIKKKQAPNKKKKRKLYNSLPTWRCKILEYTKVHNRSKVYENELRNMIEQLKDSTPVEVFEQCFLRNSRSHDQRKCRICYRM